MVCNLYICRWLTKTSPHLRREIPIGKGVQRVKISLRTERERLYHIQDLEVDLGQVIGVGDPDQEGILVTVVEDHAQEETLTEEGGLDLIVVTQGHHIDTGVQDPSLGIEDLMILIERGSPMVLIEEEITVLPDQGVERVGRGIEMVLQGEIDPVREILTGGVETEGFPGTRKM